MPRKKVKLQITHYGKAKKILTSYFTLSKLPHPIKHQVLSNSLLKYHFKEYTIILQAIILSTWSIAVDFSLGSLFPF